MRRTIILTFVVIIRINQLASKNITMTKVFKNMGLIGLISLLMVGCHFNSQFINSLEDKAAAEQVSNKLYGYVKSKQFEEAMSLFSTRFFEVTSREKLMKMFTKTNEKLGDLLETSVENWQTRKVEGTDPSTNYMFLYKNKYSRFESEESIQMQKEADGQIRITAYYINSEGFFED